MSAMPETKSSVATPTPCTEYSPDTFFPTAESRGGKPTAGERVALRICATCPIAVRGLCLERALRFPTHQQAGVVGGTTASQRRVIVRVRQAARAVETELAEAA